MDKPTRKDKPPIKVYCLPSEREQIAANARAAGLTMSMFLSKVGMGYKLRGILDHKGVEELVRINSDLGRLGDLLQGCLSGHHLPGSSARTNILNILARIEDTQSKMHEIMRAVLLPSANGRNI